MKTTACRALIALTAALIALPAGAGPAGFRQIHKALRPIPPQDPRYGQYIVTFKNSAGTPDYFNGTTQVDVDAKAGEIAHRHGARIKGSFRHALKGVLVKMSPEQALALAQDPDVEVEEDGLVTANTIQAGATFGLDRIDQRSLPLGSTYFYGMTGSGVRAYIIDTGILSTHSEFTGRVAAGYTAIADGKGTTDCNGHGTHVAGTLGGTTYGVAKGVTLVPVRVLDCTGSGTVSNVIAGVDWVTKNRVLPAVANMSLDAAGTTSSTLDAAVQNSIKAGVTYVVAAGNANTDACKTSPADVPEAITVGATDSADNRASYSNYGACVDLFAPGSGITSAWYTGTTVTSTLNGTSMAAPHVAGAAALYLSKLPGSTPAQVLTALTSNATANAVKNAGTGSPNKLLYTSFIAPTGADTTPPTISLTSPTAGKTLVGTITLTAAASDNAGLAKVDYFAGSTLIGTATASPYQLAWNTNALLNGTYSFVARATDTAGLSTTSAAVSATIANTTAMVAPSCLTASQLLLNTGFESGTASWTTTSTTIPTTAVINNASAYATHGGAWKAKLAGSGKSRTDTVYQAFSIPLNACTASLSVWVNISTAETTTTLANDTLTIAVTDTAGTTLGTLATLSNKNKTAGYVLKTYDLSAYKGKTIRLQFKGTENASLATTFLIDDVTVTISQ